jgi:hypothetical protein
MSNPRQAAVPGLLFASDGLRTGKAMMKTAHGDHQEKPDLLNGTASAQLQQTRVARIGSK